MFNVFRLAVFLAIFVASCAAALARPAAVAVSGKGYVVSKLADGGVAFANRKFVWQGVPRVLQGWDYTDLKGGQTAMITITLTEDETVYLATQAGADIPGWRRVDAFRFGYTDRNRTQLDVFARFLTTGSTVPIPQLGWSGTMVLMPELVSGQNHRAVPGVVVDHSPVISGVYLGSPSIEILSNGDYIASHDLFGPSATHEETKIFRSRDQGASWTQIADIHGLWWASLFLHRGALYLLGVDHENGHVVIRRSDDGGVDWTSAKDGSSGLLLADHAYCCGPGSVVVHGGRIWRAMEDFGPKDLSAKGYRAFVMSAPADSNLLQAANWTETNRLTYHPDKSGTNWLEGNMVVTPDNQVVNIIRVNSHDGETAALIHVTPDGKTAVYDPDRDLLNFPGGGARFAIRYDRQSKRYWSLVDKQQNPRAYRNVLALTSSPDLRHWTVDSVILQDPDRTYVAFQYVDWQFDGPDIIALSRTAFDGAHSAHDANYITFHRIKDFRDLHQ